MSEEKYSFIETEDKYNIIWEGTKVYKWNGEKDNTFIYTPSPTIYCILAIYLATVMFSSHSFSVYALFLR